MEAQAVIAFEPDVAVGEADVIRFSNQGRARIEERAFAGRKRQAKGERRRPALTGARDRLGLLARDRDLAQAVEGGLQHIAVGWVGGIDDKGRAPEHRRLGDPVELLLGQ